ncbi:MAG: hypothetical protein Unbinned8472contig1000_67 [Prokaryotic dsDNA virus sp.]|nr:MAG: hypothetical protein Unbinned8472contig1000_67 [Prokaryotic dsDNA virus sp.]|tara:strand:+ start:45130 stop:45414 length:285 start_codon:yes stop_codon:yes gene_type:complete
MMTNRDYSKVEGWFFNFFFKQLIDEVLQMEAPTKELVEAVMKNNPHYARDFMRTNFGIKRFLIRFNEEGMHLLIGLEGRASNFDLLVELGGEDE